MHILESLALSSGAKIDKPEVYEKFITLPFDENKEKYIVLAAYTSVPARNYELWGEALEILRPFLDKEGIKILQVGEQNHPKVKHAHTIAGMTDLNQLAYVIKRCLLYVGPDDVGMHMASSFGKKIVAAHGPYLPSHSGPYWSGDSDVRLLSKVQDGKPPSFFPQEAYKKVNLIHPEEIAQAVCDLLGIEFTYDYKTLFIGVDYPYSKLELIPYSYVTNINDLGVDSIIVRMDLEYGLSVLEKQLQLSKCSVVTDKEIDVQFLKHYLPNIMELIYFVDESTDISYLQKLKEAGIRFNITSRLSGEGLNKIKLKYLDFLKIIELPFGNRKSIEKIIKGKEERLFYKSSCLTVKKSNIYTSKCDDEKYNPPLGSLEVVEPRPIIDNDEFWKEVNHMTLLEKSS